MTAYCVIDAKAHHLGVVTAHAEARRALELAQARLLVDGVEGKNADQRAAVMRLELDDLHAALMEAEDARPGGGAVRARVRPG